MRNHALSKGISPHSKLLRKILGPLETSKISCFVCKVCGQHQAGSFPEVLPMVTYKSTLSRSYPSLVDKSLYYSRGTCARWILYDGDLRSFPPSVFTPLDWKVKTYFLSVQAPYHRLVVSLFHNLGQPSWPYSKLVRNADTAVVVVPASSAKFSIIAANSPIQVCLPSTAKDDEQCCLHLPWIQHS